MKILEFIKFSEITMKTWAFIVIIQFNNVITWTHFLTMNFFFNNMKIVGADRQTKWQNYILDFVAKYELKTYFKQLWAHF
jgi:hypothetical protein